jgi:hypothetical protein
MIFLSRSSKSFSAVPATSLSALCIILAGALFSGETRAQTLLIPPDPWDSYIWFQAGSAVVVPPAVNPKTKVGANPDITFWDLSGNNPQFTIGGWTLEPINPLVDPNPTILDWNQNANKSGRLTLSNLRAERAATGPDTLNIYWGGKFPGPIPAGGTSVWTIKQSMNNLAKENTLGFASKVDQYGWFQKQFSNTNPGQIIGVPSAVINVPINTTSLKTIQGSRSITQWGGSGPGSTGYRLYGRTDLRIHNGFVEFPLSSAVEAQGPPLPPDFYFIPPGGQLDGDNIYDIVLSPGEDILFDVVIDTTGLTLPHSLSDYQDILVKWEYQFDNSELALILNSNPSNSIIGIYDTLVSTLKFVGVNPGLDPHDGVNDFGITLKDVIYRSSLWGDYSVFSQFPAPNKDSLNNAGTEFNQVVEVQTPGPLPILGAGAAFGFSRKLRKRIKASSKS